MDRLQRQLCAALQARLKGQKARLPDAGGELLDAFQALSRARSCGPNGPNPITWEAVAAWMQVMRAPMSPRHVTIIMAMDEVWLSHIYGRRSAPVGVKTLPQMSAAPLSAGLFDAALG